MVVFFSSLGEKLQSHICCPLPRGICAWCGDQGCRSVIADGQRDKERERGRGKRQEGEGVVS